MGRHTKEEVERMWQYSHDYDARELAAMLVDCERNLRLEKELHRRTRAEAKRLNAAPASAEAVAVEAFRQGWARCLAANSDRFVHGCKALLPTQDDEDRAVAHALRAKGAK